jgi:DNA-binding MarR family transcriptional regulator
MAAGVAGAGFVLSLFLPQRPLREAASTSTGLDDGLAAPRSPDSLAEIERALTKVTTPQERSRFRSQIAERAGVEISPGAIWALVRIDEYGFGRARALAEEEGVDPARVSEVLAELRERGLIADDDGRHLTTAGREHTQRIVSARCDLLAEALADDTADRHREVAELLKKLARELCGEPPQTTSSPPLSRSAPS